MFKKFLCRVLGHQFVRREEYRIVGSDIAVTDLRPLFTCARCGKGR